MSVNPIHEQDIVAVVVHMNTEITATFGTMSKEAENSIAREIAIENLNSYNARYAGDDDPHKEQRVDVEWYSKYNFPFHSYQEISHVQCVKYVHAIIDNCDGSPTWENSGIKKTLESWQEHLLDEIFLNISSLKPSRMDINYAVHKERWYSALEQVVKCSRQYTRAKYLR
jgi:hypothetical protein